ncbi:MAG: tRNA (adenosine(37)-N6)-threonylcarbamoyltransferase complex dimerization subunit type 1 TsaB [Bacillota bacterium]|nr:tRNA (adenosine(37)-N6)-threonylcarbamoyltransferase complex dimerization subunit type 1 TsaB [Bacillota bacterium]
MALLILGIDTTTLACSVALLQGDKLLAELTLNIKKTHSERLMPLLDQMLTESGIEREQLEAVAVAAGPGSFTGLRIGISTARALAQGLDIPVVGVGTLEALAEAITVPNALICPLLDARRSQVYTALYRRPFANPANLETLIEPAALSLSELTLALEKYHEPVNFIGEGLNSYAAELEKALPGKAVIGPPQLRICRASLVAFRGGQLLTANPPVSYNDLLPQYLRRPEAERLTEKKERTGS